MRLFQQRAEIQTYRTAKEFVEAFGIGRGDFVLASRSIFERYFDGLCPEAVVCFKGDYGSGEPTDVMIDGLMEDFRKGQYGRIVAIGGGAVIDMAKILVLDTEASAADIFQRKTSIRKVRELIAVPTTCGAGSEVSNVSIAELTALETKMGIAENALYADYAVLIPQLLEELPYRFFATSAIDALIHAIESFVSPKACAYTEMFSREAIRLILRGFQRMEAQGEEARFAYLEEFLNASTMAGVAFGNAGTGAVHAMSYPLSGKYHVAHGEANYQFLVAVFRKYQALKPEGKIREINAFLAQQLGCETEEVYERLEKLLDCIIGRRPLREYGMKEAEIPVFADSVVAGQQRLLGQSYVKFDAQIMQEIYRELY